MSSFRQIFYHIVFGTKNREMSIPNENSELLYKFIWGIIRNKNCKLYRVNGSPDHVHIFCDLHPSISLESLVKDIKVASSIWMKGKIEFPQFKGWAEGYAAITVSLKEKNTIIEYIKNQKKHHRKVSFAEEHRKFLKDNGIEFDEKYLIK